MKYVNLIFLAACFLLLGGCSNLPSQAAGPQGGGDPLPLNETAPMPRSAVLPERPMARRRRNAQEGRLSAPGDNIAGGQDCPIWLYVAQKQEGLFLSCDFAAGAGGNSAPPLDFVSFAGQVRNFAAADAAGRPVSRSGLFADWCLAQAEAGMRGGSLGRLGPGAAIAENWLNYGAPAAPCLGALMVAQERGRYCLAFCVGAVSLPFGGARAEPVYLGLGIMPDGAEESSRIGLVAFAASSIAAFRLPPHYRPGKEQYRLDCTPWAEQFSARIAQRLAQQSREQADILPSPPPAPAFIRTDAARRPPAMAGAGQENAPDSAAHFAEEDLAAALERELAGADFSAAPGFAAAPPEPPRRNGAGQRRSGAGQPGAEFYPAPPPSPLRRYI